MHLTAAIALTCLLLTVPPAGADEQVRLRRIGAEGMGYAAQQCGFAHGTLAIAP